MNKGLTEFWLERQKKLEADIHAHKKELSQLPKGTLIMNTHRNTPQWFLQRKNKDDEYTRTYLGKDKLDLTIKLARKAYLKQLIKDEENELACITEYLAHRQPVDFSKFRDMNSPYCRLIFNTNWGYEPYQKSDSHPEHLKIRTQKGDIVRSKSEALIADTLFEMDIPYRYEWVTLIGNEPMAPDFTIMNPRTDSLIIWEHFGKIGDAGYYADWQKKMYTYTHNGFVPGYNMITTYENRDHPLDSQEVYATITHYLL